MAIAPQKAACRPVGDVADGDVKLVAFWTAVTRRPQGERTDLLDNVQEVTQAPTGTSAAAGIRRLQKRADEGNEDAAAQLAEVWRYAASRFQVHVDHLLAGASHSGGHA